MMNNMNNGLMFGMEGPNMEGTWYNPQTGDSFTVRNSFFQDNQYIVQTTDGRIIEYNQLQHYVQSDRPIEMPKPQPKKEELPAEVANLLADDSADTDYLLPEDAALLQGTPKTLGSLNDTMVQTTTTAPVMTTGYSQVVGPMIELNDFTIIEKALGKKQLPDIQVGIDWKNFPEKEINMLIDVMEIPAENIVKWYANQIDVDYVAECLRVAMRDYIFDKVMPYVREIVEQGMSSYTIESYDLPKEGEIVTFPEPGPADELGQGGAFATEPKKKSPKRTPKDKKTTTTKIKSKK